MRIPFIGGAYAGVSPNTDSQVMIGFYPEFDPKDSRSPRYAVPCPSITSSTFTTPTSLAIYGAHYSHDSGGTNNSRICLIGDNGVGGVNLNDIALTGILNTAKTFSSFTVGTLPPQMFDNGINNGQQMLIFNPSQLAAWVFNFGTGTLTQVNGTVNWQTVTPSYIGYQDTYGIVVQANSCTFWITNSFDFAHIGGLNFAQPQSITDQLNVAISDNIRLYLMGNTGMEVWYNSGDPNFTFTRIPGTVFSIGCTSPMTAVKLDNSIVWLGVTDLGKTSIYQSRGLQPPSRISTTQIDYQLQAALASPNTNASKAYAYAYQEQGHLFYCLVINNNCWCYDGTNQEWHTRTNFGKGNHVMIPYNDNPATLKAGLSLGQHLFSGDNTATAMQTFASSPTNDQTRQIISPHMNDEQKDLFVNGFQVNFNSNDTVNPPVGTMTFSWSMNDNNFQSTGNLTGGSYPFLVGSQPRFMMRRLGWAKDWVFKLDCSSMTTAPIIMDGFATIAYRTEGSPGNVT